MALSSYTGVHIYRLKPSSIEGLPVSTRAEFSRLSVYSAPSEKTQASLLALSSGENILE